MLCNMVAGKRIDHNNTCQPSTTVPRTIVSGYAGEVLWGDEWGLGQSYWLSPFTSIKFERRLYLGWVLIPVFSDY